MADLTVQQKIEEFKARINLLEGDRKAYYENSQWTIKQNRECIAKLRRENKDVRNKLSECLTADEHVLDQAFQDRQVDRTALKNKTGPDAIVILDHKLSDHVKRLNQLKHETVSKQQRLEELRTKHDEMLKDASVALASEAGESPEATLLRSLENRLDKALLKSSEAEQIKKTYTQIKAKLEEEAMMFPAQLDAMETLIRKSRLELKELQSMRTDAQVSKDSTLSELRKHEEAVYADRKRRDIELQKVKKDAEDTRLHHEKTEKRIAQRNANLTTDDAAAAAQPDKAPHSASQEISAAAKVTTYEEAFKLIKETTGVSDTSEVVGRFENQEETSRHLDALKLDAEVQIAKLKSERGKLQGDYEDMKYSGNAKLSSGQLMLEEFEASVKAEEVRRSSLLEKVNDQNKVLFNIKTGVEHLFEKLSHLKSNKAAAVAPRHQAAGSATGSRHAESEELVLDLVTSIEDKLLKLIDDLDNARGGDLASVVEEMEREEFHAQLEGKLPQYNTRVKLPLTQRDYVYDDEDDSGDDEGDVVTRNSLKKQAEQLIESKNKRRVVKRNKKP